VTKIRTHNVPEHQAPEPENVGRDFDEEGVELGGVPVGKDVGHLPVRQVHHVLHHVVGFGDELQRNPNRLIQQKSEQFYKVK